MANPPITIGELTDVPAPESPINAQFHQEVANRIAHRFANVAAMNGWAAGNGSLAFTIDTQTLWVRRSGAWHALSLQAALDAVTATVATLPLGILQRTYGAAVTGVGGATELCRVTWTADPSRWYRISGFAGWVQNNTPAGGGPCALEIWDAGSTILKSANGTHNQNHTRSYHLESIESGLSGSIVRRLVVVPSGGTTFSVTAALGTAPQINVADEGNV